MAPSRTSAPWNWRAWCCAKTRERCMASKLRALTAGSFRPPPPSGGSSGKYVGNWRASAPGWSEEAVELAAGGVGVGGRGGAGAGGWGEEAVELAAGGVEGALLLRRAAMNKRATVLVDHVTEKPVSRLLSQGGS